MKSTYNKLPWEEVEFCLVCYIHSHTKQQEINLFTRAILNINKILNFLDLFAKNLEKEKNIICKSTNIEGLTEIPLMKREKVINGIMAACPLFQELYSDYQALRDVHSLQKINDYIKLALSADPKEREGQLVITRALLVIGEYFKNTLESPKLSAITSEHLLLTLPKNTGNVIVKLRNSLSHSYTLSKRTEIFESSNTDFFIGIQNDIKKIGDRVWNILYANKLNTVRLLLKRVVESDTLFKIREIKEVLGYAKFDLCIPVNFVSSDYEKLQKLISQLRMCISGKTSYEEQLFNQIEYHLKSCNGLQSELTVHLNYTKSLASLVAFQITLENHKVDATAIKLKNFSANRILKDIAPQIESSNLKKIAEFTMKIFNSVRSRGQIQIIDEVTRLTWEIFHRAELGTDDIKLIKELRDKLSKTRPLVEFNKEKETYKMKEAIDNNQLFQKFSELRDVMKENGLSGDLMKNIPSYKKNKKLQAAVEMLVLDIMSILDTSKNCLENNMFFLDNNTPLLIGKSLRNHLAHDNNLVDILLSNPAVAIILNAKKLYSENLGIIHKKVGQFVRDEPSRLKERYNSSMNIIINQEKLFIALEEGRVEDLNDLLKDGADMNARSVHLGWTCLHFASKGSSLQCVKLVLDHTLNIDKDVNGQTALHIAARYGRADTVKLFVEKYKVCPDVKDNNIQTALHLAARNGHNDVVQILLKNRANFRILDVPGLGALHYAISNRHIKTAKILLTEGSDIEIKGGFTALHQAAEVGCSEILSFLLENGANVNSKNDNDYTPLHVAAFHGHQEVVEILLSKGANVNAKVLNGLTPLHHAVECGYEQITNVLIDSGAEVNDFDKTCGNTPLHYAATDGYEEIIKTLLQNKANVNAVNVQGETPLHCAVRNGHYTTTILLLTMNSYRDALDNTGAAPLDTAVLYGHSKIVDLLLAPVRPSSRSDWLRANNESRIKISRLLHVAARRGDGNIVEMLINKGADVNHETFNGTTPLHSAALKGNKNVIDLLIKNNANVEARTFLDEIPLHLAAISGEKDAVEILLKNKAQVNANAYQGLPIHYAISAGHKDIVFLLVKSGADINAVDPSGNTPLFLAVEGGHKEIVQFIIEAGVNINVTSNGKSPLFLAVTNNDIDMVELLTRNGATVDNELNNSYSETSNPLVFAISAGNKEIVEVLLKTEVSVDMILSNNTTLLHLATQQGDKDIVKALIAKGATIEAKTIDGTTPLFIAAQNGYKDVVEVLITNGADRNMINDATALHLAVSQGHLDVVEFLLENGASATVPDSKYRTPIKIAVSNGDLKTVNILLQNESVVEDIKSNRNSKDNQTLLHISSEGCNIQLVKLLVDRGYNIDAKNTSGSKPIHIAAREGFKDAVQFYISKGMNINERDSVNQTLLHYAAMKPQNAVLEYLIEHGANVNDKDDNGLTPMHVAAMYNSVDTIKLLMENDADYIALDNKNRKPLDIAQKDKVINVLRSTENLFQAVKHKNSSDIEKYIRAGALVDAKRGDSGTVLHYAAWKGYDNIVEVLLENGANTNAICKNKTTPLHYAAKFGHSKVVFKLLSSGAIYNALSEENGKTPCDLSVDSEICSLFNLVKDSFKQVKDSNVRVINNLNKIENLDIVKAVMGARNRENESLIANAIHCKFPKVEELKNVFQGDIAIQIMEATMISYQGDHARALAIFKSIFERRKAVLGPNNPGTLDIEERISRILSGMGLLKEALCRIENVWEKRKDALGVNSLDTLGAKHLVALLIHKLGRNSEALPIFREVHEKQSALLGLEHTDTIDTQFDMALVLDKLGRHEEALDINRMVYEKRRKLTGENSSTTIMALNNIAMVLSNQGRSEEALEIFKSVLEKKNKVFGRSHQSTLRTLDNIPKVLIQLGKHDEALKKYQECWEMKKNALGQYHPETLGCKFNIGLLYMNQGKWVSALKAYREVYDRTKATFGPNDSMVLHIKQHLEVIKVALSFQGTDIWEVIQHLQKNINIAAQEGDLETVRSLLKTGEDINDKDVDGRTLLHFAVTSRKINIVKYLLDNGADVTLCTNKGNTPLHTAANMNSSEELVKLLLDHVNKDQIKDFINAKTTGSGSTALHIAATNNSLHIVKSLLKRGADYKIKNNQGKEPLDLANDQQIRNILSLIEDMFAHTKNGNLELIRKLREADSDIVAAVTNARNDEDKTILQLAIAKRHNNLAKQLLELIKRDS